jgi:hypothetical protein
MGTLESVFAGVMIAIISLFIGKMWGEKSKVSDGVCKERQEGCFTAVCVELQSIKDSQKEMKDDMKEIKRQFFSMQGKNLD